MQLRDLTAKFNGWVSEYARLTKTTCPEGLGEFLANRAMECDGLLQAGGTVRIKLPDGRTERVTIEGVRGEFLSCARAAGVGFYMVKTDAVIPEDRGVLTDILNQMLQDGKLTAAT